MFGTIEVHAYQMLAQGEIIRDSRVIYVQPSRELKINVKADRALSLEEDTHRHTGYESGDEDGDEPRTPGRPDARLNPPGRTVGRCQIRSDAQ